MPGVEVRGRFQYYIRGQGNLNKKITFQQKPRGEGRSNTDIGERESSLEQRPTGRKVLRPMWLNKDIKTS